MDGHGRHCKGVGPSGSAIGFHRVCGNGAARMGNARWRRLTEVTAPSWASSIMPIRRRSSCFSGPLRAAMRKAPISWRDCDWD